MINNKPILGISQTFVYHGYSFLDFISSVFKRVHRISQQKNPPLMSATLSFPADRGFALRPWNQASLGIGGWLSTAMVLCLGTFASAMGIHHCFCWDLLINYGIYHVYYGCLLWDLLINIWQHMATMVIFHGGPWGFTMFLLGIFQQWTTTWSRSSNSAPGSQVRFDNAKISIRGDKAQAMGQIRVVDACEILTSWYPAW